MKVTYSFSSFYINTCLRPKVSKTVMFYFNFFDICVTCVTKLPLVSSISRSPSLQGLLHESHRTKLPHLQCSSPTPVHRQSLVSSISPATAHTPHSDLSVLQSVQYKVYSTECTVQSVQCTVQRVQYRVYSTEFTVQSLQYRVYYTECTAQSVQYRVYTTVCTVQSVQYRVSRNI